MTRALIAAVLLCAFVPSADGQGTQPGITWSGTTGNFAGTFGFQCEPLQVPVTPGETVTLAVWGDFQAPFAVLASFGSTSCQVIPGVGNALLLDHPATVTEAGHLNQFNSCGGPCPSGFEDMIVAVSPSLPLGTSLTVQAVTVAGSQLKFTSAISATVQ